MFSVKALTEFSAWLNGLSDAALRGVVVARIKRLERGLMGGCRTGGRGYFGIALSLGRGQARVFHAGRQADGSLHLKKMLNEGELEENQVAKEYLITAADGKNFHPQMVLADFVGRPQ